MSDDRRSRRPVLQQLASAANQALRRLGLEMRRYPEWTEAMVRRNRLLQHHGIDLVLDVGANAGQFATELRQRLRYSGRIVSFEPLADAFAKLQRAAVGDARWDVLQFGLADRCGQAQINVSQNSVSSSMLETLPVHLATAPESRCIARETVEVRTLDMCLPSLQHGSRRIWLKIDAQGYEHHILDGARASLAQIDTVQLEMSLLALYAGAPLLADTCAYLHERGFGMVGLESGFANERTGEMLQVDGIFRRVRPA